MHQWVSSGFADHRRRAGGWGRNRSRVKGSRETIVAIYVHCDSIKDMIRNLPQKEKVEKVRK
jgi:hypothetical protein